MRDSGIISLPTHKNTELKQIDFLRLSDNKILAILINKSNDVENKIINLDKNYTSSELQEASNYLNSIIINLFYLILIMPGLYLSYDPQLSRYWFFILLLIYLIIYSRLYRFTKN